MSKLHAEMHELNNSDSDSDSSEKRLSKKQKTLKNIEDVTLSETTPQTKNTTKTVDVQKFLHNLENKQGIFPTDRTETPSSWEGMVKPTQLSLDSTNKETSTPKGDVTESEQLSSSAEKQGAVKINPPKELSTIIGSTQDLKEIKRSSFDKSKKKEKSSADTREIDIKTSDDLSKIIRWGDLIKYNSLPNLSEKEQNVALNDAKDAMDRIYTRLRDLELTSAKMDKLNGVFGRPFELDLDKVSTDEKDAYYDLIKRRSDHLSDAKDAIDNMKNNKLLSKQVYDRCVVVSENLGVSKGWPEYFRGQEGAVSKQSKRPKSDAAPSTDPVAALQAWHATKPLIEELLADSGMYEKVKPFLRKLIRDVD